jgi:hypothetical protein
LRTGARLLPLLLEELLLLLLPELVLVGAVLDVLPAVASGAENIPEEATGICAAATVVLISRRRVERSAVAFGQVGIVRVSVTVKYVKVALAWLVVHRIYIAVNNTGVIRVFVVRVVIIRVVIVPVAITVIPAKPQVVVISVAVVHAVVIVVAAVIVAVAIAIDVAFQEGVAAVAGFHAQVMILQGVVFIPLTVAVQAVIVFLNANIFVTLAFR